jgi:dihydrodipicolinate synthase/N-acetylneuraminate lyase
MAARSSWWSLVILVALVNSFDGQMRQATGAVPMSPSGDPCAWAGIYPTVLAPFCDHGGVDVASLEAQVRYQLHGCVSGLLVLGTIGEGEYASMDERAQVIATAVHATAGRCPGVPVIVGIHTCDLDMAQAQLIQAKELGAAAVLVKYLGNPKASPSTVLGFLMALSDLHILPIFYYHYPSETKLKLAPEDVAHILSLPGVVGIKESTLDLREVKAHLGLTRGQGKTFLSGTALNLSQFLALGGHGAMCPEAVLLPGPTVQAYTAFTHGRHDEARWLQEQLFVLTPILKDRPTPPGVARTLLMTAQDHCLAVPMGHDHPQARLKAALNCLGVPTPIGVSCPLPPLTAREQKRVAETVARMQKIDWYNAALQVPPAPLSTEPVGVQGGMLLKTGSFQLGPNVGRDLLRSQGDGKAGF